MAVRAVSAVVSKSCASRGNYFSTHISWSPYNGKKFCGVKTRDRFMHSTSYNGNLWQHYADLKLCVEGASLPSARDPSAVYANNELQLGEVDVYGFDYDYTIACYNDNLNKLIYDLGRSNLINDYKYPANIDHADYDYDPSFSVRGLHCDVKKGYLLKIDAFHNIQMGTVYCGLQPVGDETVLKNYGGKHLSLENLSNYYGSGPMMQQLMDMFAFPEMNLYANVIEWFNQHDVMYDPEHVFYDVRNAVQSLHISGKIHKCIMENHEKFINRLDETSILLKRLSDAGKKLFLITNSSANFVDKGMTYLVGFDWMKYFDVVITHARKPKFFHDKNRPFRIYDPKSGATNWNRVDRLVKGTVYEQGNVGHLIQLTGWSGGRVLYIGDHVYTDLADATLKLGWRTGALIPELENEIRIINTEKYMKALIWLTALESLISRMQSCQDAESQQVLADWIVERNQLRLLTKGLFNKRFGSLFRTHHNATYFTRRLNRFADIYMSSAVNLLNYPLNYTFYPQRTALPHELVTPSFTQ